MSYIGWMMKGKQSSQRSIARFSVGIVIGNSFQKKASISTRQEYMVRVNLSVKSATKNFLILGNLNIIN